ncbi:F-box domain-containing protein [Mycena chlorophos]|uniref:F-box domain-containing protein n=1 Tax=Mycena chlorophos TaxID=658473 RepID=A0A8H6SA60_MYCCL|nr:F-box domain-containing protein [Mycena chlorophos]
MPPDASVSHDVERARFRAVEAEISTLEGRLDALRTERAEIQARRMDTFSFPVLTLPTEIMAEIFTRFLPPYPSHPPLSGPESPTRLLAICRLWRTIALQNRTLWRAIHVGGRVEVDEELLSVVREWFSRSGTCKLSLRFDNLYLGFGPGMFVKSFEGGKKHLLDLALSHRQRWEYIHWTFNPSLTPAISGPAPELRQLTLISAKTTDYPPITFGPLPRLRSLCLWNVPYTLDTFAWHELTSLSLLNYNFEQILPVLGSATQLVRCRLHISYDGQASQEYHTGRIELPRLETFLLYRISHGAAAWGSDRLAPFVLPSLRRLEISENFLGDETSPDCEWLRSMISRSRCALERLRVLREFLAPEVDDLPEQVQACRAAFPDVVLDYTEDYDIDGEDEWTLAEYWDVKPTRRWSISPDSESSSSS